MLYHGEMFFKLSLMIKLEIYGMSTGNIYLDPQTTE